MKDFLTFIYSFRRFCRAVMSNTFTALFLMIDFLVSHGDSAAHAFNKNLLFAVE